ncbi:MAG: NINE protein [Ruminococcus sp.]|jgi:tryptophan-rich sensory protein|nr:NINE protein [Ruminococcus sp.]
MEDFLRFYGIALLVTALFFQVYHIVVYLRKEQPFWSANNPGKILPLIILFLFIINGILSFMIFGGEAETGQVTYYVNGVRTNSFLVSIFYGLGTTLIFAPAEYGICIGLSYIPIVFIKAFSPKKDTAKSDVIHKQKAVALVLAIFLGLFGAHDLYLRRYLHFALRIILSFGSAIIVGLISRNTGIDINSNIITIPLYGWCIFDIVYIAVKKQIKTHKKTIIFD